jgi:1,4-alpha-glucan branching enzyme
MTSVHDDGTIRFRFYRPGAEAVSVVGTFNRWGKQALPMRALGNGWWAADVSFDPGEYQFRYVADGHWYTDYAAHGVANTRHGWNSVLIVPERTICLNAAVAHPAVHAVAA